MKSNQLKIIKITSPRNQKKTNKKRTYLNRTYLYLNSAKQKKNEFQLINNYSLLQTTISWLDVIFYTKKYLKNMEIFKKINRILIYKYKTFLQKNPNNLLTKINTIWNFLYLYNFFFLTFFNDLYYLSKSLKNKKKRANYYLILTFTNNKIFINLQNTVKKNFFFLSAGLFIKFFEKKKSFKKNKTIKLLMAKFLRKLFIISKIKNIILIIKKTPLHLIEFLTLVNTPIIHKFTDPIEKKLIEEKEFNKLIVKFTYFIFFKNTDFSLNKGAQKGRIKRKILRKIVINNKLID